MKHVVNWGYATYTDPDTESVFSSTLHAPSGRMIAVLEADDAAAAAYDGRDGFEVLGPDQFSAAFPAVDTEGQ